MRRVAIFADYLFFRQRSTPSKTSPLAPMHVAQMLMAIRRRCRIVILGRAHTHTIYLTNHTSFFSFTLFSSFESVRLTDWSTFHLTWKSNSTHTSAMPVSPITGPAKRARAHLSQGQKVNCSYTDRPVSHALVFFFYPCLRIAPCFRIIVLAIPPHPLARVRAKPDPVQIAASQNEKIIFIIIIFLFVQTLLFTCTPLIVRHNHFIFRLTAFDASCLPSLLCESVCFVRQ